MNYPKEKNQKKYRAVIQYDRDFPKYFNLGDLSKNEANVVYALLGEIRDRYSPEGITISYTDIAYMSDNVMKDSKGRYYANTGSHFDKFIENLLLKIHRVSYRKLIKVDENGKSHFYDYFLFTDKFDVNHIDQELTVHISDSIYQDEIIDEDGNVIQKKKSIADLFNNENWSETKYLKFGRELHNQLNKYAQNLYRWIAEYRSFTHPIPIEAEEFENVIMKFITPSAKKEKIKILNKAIEELNNLTYSDGRPIFRDLEYTVERRKRKIIKYTFTFKPFSVDLNYIKRIDGNNITFTSQLNAPDNQIEHTRIIEKFLETFSGQKEYDNKNNRKRLIAFCESMSDDVVEEALDRVAMDKKRGAGWLFKMLENWEKQGVKKLEDIEGAEDKIFNPQKKDVPSWSNPDYVNTTTEEQKQEAEKETLRLLDELNKKKPHNHKKNNVPSWSNPNYVNTTSDEKKAELENKKQEMLARLHNKQPK
mgnify:FL=1